MLRNKGMIFAGFADSVWCFNLFQKSHLGQGTCTNIYDGVLHVCGGATGDDEAEYFSTEQNNNHREIHVVLKMLDPSHRDIALVSKQSETTKKEPVGNLRAQHPACMSFVKRAGELACFKKTMC